MRTLILSILILFPFISYSQEKRLALVIGNGIYEYGGRLLNPENDSRAMANTLTFLGFDVMAYENIDQKSMLMAIDDFGLKLMKYDVGLFFYAGHGVQAKGYNYLIPVDAEIFTENDVEYNCVEVGRVLAKMEDAGSKTNIVILDACRDNPFERSWTRSTKGSGLASMNAPVGSIIAYATAPGNTASDGTGDNGLYTSALLKYMIEPGLKIEDIFKRVRTIVKEQSNETQIPWESTSLEGDFYFNYDNKPASGDNFPQTNVVDNITNGSAGRSGTLTDSRDGQSYKWVRIGNKIWMAENLNYSTSIGSWCYDNKENNCGIYGRLYNWETAKKVCPAGWHLPNESEWNKLIDFLTGDDLPGGKLKETGNLYWEKPNTSATNESGFTALPGGFCSYDGESFYRIGLYAYFWSSTELAGLFAWSLRLLYDDSYVDGHSNNKGYGFSVRCIKDR